MAGRGIRIYTDEDVDAQLAVQLRRHGYDALSTTEAGKSSLGLDDDSQLRFASRLQRAILVHNLRHFVPLDAAWKERGAQHYEIIAAEQTALAALF